jgi:hypothetical protein
VDNESSPSFGGSSISDEDSGSGSHPNTNQHHTLSAIASAAAALSAPAHPIMFAPYHQPVLVPQTAIRALTLAPVPIPTSIAGDAQLSQLYQRFQDFGRVVYSVPPAPPLVPLGARGPTE